MLYIELPCWATDGALHSGGLTGVLMLLLLSHQEVAANVLLHVRAAVKRRDEAVEAERYITAGIAEFPGIVERIQAGSQTQQVSGRRQANPRRISSDARGRQAEDKA